ncbi:MAG: nicotinate-nucleotide--dimethylbenzimidazole phosphoribosyltransferase [Hydrogenophaga sp.]|nr:nicotinate-nucleotide--dimethylbenzimidazole phosphoribosyltransferase [Hydrogenophaga sp.]
MARHPALTPINARPFAPVPGLNLPVIAPTADALLDHALDKRLQPAAQPPMALGRLRTLALQLARIRNGPDRPAGGPPPGPPQLVVFAADHGLADEGLSEWPPSTTCEHVWQLLAGDAPVSALARRHGFDVTVVDAGVATPLAAPPRSRPPTQLQHRKIGFGTRNALLGPAMSLPQAVAAIHAGMDVVRHLPGNVLALGDIGVANAASAALLLARLCGVPPVDAFPRADVAGDAQDDTRHWQRLDKLQVALQRHAKALSPVHALAAFGGFETAMLVGAMLQGASERRVVIVDGFVAGAAALVARGLCPAVVDYLVHAQRLSAPPHRLMLIHLQAQPLLDLDLALNQGTGALLAWPLVQAAQALTDTPV